MFTPSPIKIAVFLDNDVAQVNAYAKQNLPIGRNAVVARRHSALDRDATSHSFHDRRETNENAIAILQSRGLDVHRWPIDEFTAKHAKPG